MTLAKRGKGGSGFSRIGGGGAGGRYHIIGEEVGDEHSDDNIPHTRTHSHTLFMYDMYVVLHCARQITTTTTTTTTTTITTTTTTTSFFDF